MRIIISFLFIFFINFFYIYPQQILILPFEPYQTSTDKKIEIEIQNKLKEYLSQKGFIVTLANEDLKSVLEKKDLNKDFIIHGFYKKGKYNLSIYGQIYDAKSKYIIDAFSLTDALDKIEEDINLPVEEIKETDENRIQKFVENIYILISTNKEKKKNYQNIQDYLLSEDLSKSYNFNIYKGGEEEQVKETLKLFQQEQYVISATKTKILIQDTPAAMSVITDEEIKKYNYKSLEEALARVPEVYTHYNGHNFSSDFRGFFVNNIERRVLYLLDGMKLNDRFHFGDFYPDTISDLDFVERIEVIRGPGAALYGNNSVLGVVNIITKKNKDQDTITISSEFSHLKKDSLLNKSNYIYLKRFNNNHYLNVYLSYFSGSILYDTKTNWENHFGKNGVTKVNFSTDTYFKADNGIGQNNFSKGYEFPNLMISYKLNSFEYGIYHFTKRATWVWPKDNNSFGHPDNDRVWGSSSFFIRYQPVDGILNEMDFQLMISHDINTNREISHFDMIKARNRVLNVLFGANQTAWILGTDGIINYVHFWRQIQNYLTDNAKFDDELKKNGSGARFNYHGIDKTNSLDFQITPYKSEQFIFMLGGNFFYSYYDNYQKITFANNQFIGWARFGGISDKGHQYGIWNQFFINFSKSFSIITGVRYDFQKIQNVERQLGGYLLYRCNTTKRDIETDIAKCQPFQKKNAISKDITPRISFNYKITSQQNIRLIYSEAFRNVPPQEVIRLAPDPITGEIKEAKSEKTKSYEFIYFYNLKNEFLFGFNVFYLIGTEIYSWNPSFSGFYASSGWRNTGGSLEIKYTKENYEIWFNTTKYKLQRSVNYEFTVIPGSADFIKQNFGTITTPAGTTLYRNGYPLPEHYRPLDSPEFLLKAGANTKVFKFNHLGLEIYHNGRIQTVHQPRNKIEVDLNNKIYFVPSSSIDMYELYEVYNIPASTFYNFIYYYKQEKFSFTFKIHNVFNQKVWYILNIEAESSFGGVNLSDLDPYKRTYQRPHKLPSFGRLYSFKFTLQL